MKKKRNPRKRIKRAAIKKQMTTKKLKLRVREKKGDEERKRINLKTKREIAWMTTVMKWDRWAALMEKVNLTKRRIRKKIKKTRKIKRKAKQAYNF